MKINVPFAQLFHKNTIFYMHYDMRDRSYLYNKDLLLYYKSFIQKYCKNYNDIFNLNIKCFSDTYSYDDYYELSLGKIIDDFINSDSYVLIDDDFLNNLNIDIEIEYDNISIVLKFITSYIININDFYLLSDDALQNIINEIKNTGKCQYPYLCPSYYKYDYKKHTLKMFSFRSNYIIKDTNNIKNNYKSIEENVNNKNNSIVTRYSFSVDKVLDVQPNKLKNIFSEHILNSSMSFQITGSRLFLPYAKEGQVYLVKYKPKPPKLLFLNNVSNTSISYDDLIITINEEYMPNNIINFNMLENGYLSIDYIKYDDNSVLNNML